MSLLFCAFLALFSLDVFDGAATAWDVVIGLFMHNIPVFILLIVTMYAWRHELVGAVVFGLFGVWYVSQLTLTIIMNPSAEMPPILILAWSLQIAAPALATSFLYYLNWRRKRPR
jgi:hypothetical protein